MLDTPRPNAYPNFAVYRTDGTLLFSKDTVGTVFCVGCGSGSYEMHPIMNTSMGAKLYLFHTNSVQDSIEYMVYGLCGTLPESIIENKSVKFFCKGFS